MQNAAQADAHVQAFWIASEIEDYHAACRASAESDDFGDRCYYADRADDALARLRQMGQGLIAYALQGPPLRRAA